MRSTYTAVLALLCVAVSGCTTSLSTSREVRSAHADDAVRGIPYTLPILQYEIKVTRVLSQCVEKVGDGKAAKSVPSVKFAVKAEATPVYVPGETFSIDYEKLGGISKTTSLTIENHEAGTLKSINATVEDRSAEIIAATVKTAVGIASIASGIPIPSAADGGKVTEQMLVCTPEAEKLLNAIETASADLKTATGELTKTTDRVTLLSEQARANALSEAGKQELLEKLKEQTAKTKAVAAAQGKVEKAAGVVSTVAAIRWPQAFDQSRTYFELTGPDLQKLAKLVVQAALVAGTDNATENRCDAHRSVQTCLGEKLMVGSVIEPLVPQAPGTLDSATGAISPETAQMGIFVRPPEAGRLILCRNAENDLCSSASKEVLLRAPDAMVPQLGQLRFLPFKNDAFENNVITLALRSNGTVEKFEYKTLKAQGEAIANTAAGAVGQIGGFLDASRQAREAEATELAALEKATRDKEIATLQFEIDKLTKEQELAKLTQPPTVSELATVKSDAELSNARRALYEALLAEREAKAALEQ